MFKCFYDLKTHKKKHLKYNDISFLFLINAEFKTIEIMFKQKHLRSKNSVRRSIHIQGIKIIYFKIYFVFKCSLDESFLENRYRIVVKLKKRGKKQKNKNK